MKVQKITFQHYCDFSAIMECEHCASTQNNKYGYNDAYYYNNVIPAMYCDSCGLNRAGNKKILEIAS